MGGYYRILRWITRKWDVGVWTGSSWLRIGFWVPQNAGNFLTSWKPVIISRRTLLHGVSNQVSRLKIRGAVSTFPYGITVWRFTDYRDNSIFISHWSFKFTANTNALFKINFTAGKLHVHLHAITTHTGGGGIAPLSSSALVGVSGQFHEPDTLTSEKEAPRYPLNRRLGGTQSRYGRFAVRPYTRNFLLLPLTFPLTIYVRNKKFQDY
jgi:hypothetical protein